MSKSDILNISGYSKYNPEAKRLAKINPLDEIYPPLPAGRFTGLVELMTTLNKYAAEAAQEDGD